MKLGDVVNQLHNEHSLADTCTTEETNLATLCVRSEQIDNLNTYLKDESVSIRVFAQKANE